MQKAIGTYELPPEPERDEERLITLATFHQDERVEGPFTVSLGFKRAQPGRIVGHVIGDSLVAERLSFRSNTAIMRSLPSKGVQEVFCDGIVVLASYQSHWGGDSPSLTGVAGVFEAANLELRHSIETGSAARSVVFLLGGPTRVWRVWRSIVDPNGTFKNTELEGLHPTFALSLQPEEVVWLENERRHRVSTFVPCLRISEGTSHDDIEDDGFVAEATALADDILVLASFLSDAPITWFLRRTRLPNTVVERHVSRVNWSEPPESDRDAVDDQRAFLRQALPRLRYWRVEGLDMTRPIGYLLSASEASGAGIAQRFASAFLALENLVTFHAMWTAREFTIAKEQFKADIMAPLKDKIRELLPGDEAKESRNLLHQKLNDLNRPAFLTRLHWLLDHYNVRWSDLYPDNHNLTKPAFIDIRDQLFHSGSGANEDRLEYRSVACSNAGGPNHLSHARVGWGSPIPSLCWTVVPSPVPGAMTCRPELRTAAQYLWCGVER